MTHFHPDHLGNAGWFAETYGTDLWITHEEWLMGRLLAIDATEATEEATVDFYRRCEVEPENIFELKNRGAEYNKMVTSIPRRFRRMYDGGRIEIGGFEWEVITGFGHAPEHACLYCEERRLLLSGDQILPRITPFVGVHPMEPEANPLARFLSSLAKFRRLHPETLVLPAHELPFTGVLDRIEVMREHHEERLDVLHRACAPAMTARAGVDVLFRRELDAQNLRLATNETLSHLNMLIARGQMERTVRGDGVWEFASAEISVRCDWPYSLAARQRAALVSTMPSAARRSGPCGQNMRKNLRFFRIKTCEGRSDDMKPKRQNGN